VKVNLQSCHNLALLECLLVDGEIRMLLGPIIIVTFLKHACEETVLARQSYFCALKKSKPILKARRRVAFPCSPECSDLIDHNLDQIA